ncbi:hypothetical protein [[Actinomadura] parvosata]|uniref:hypothetical protein n=1 Tax=[Actinomadura] parvosata TaxID=1955412 RepID=UPI0012BCADFE|nr:hypothetical protein [Nonomuraea sp. ATCC 55076]
MSGAHRTSGTAVLADQNGRRRRVLMIVAALGGTLTLACAAVLIGGTFNGTRLDAVNRPGGDDAPSASATAPPSSQDPTTRPPTARLLRTTTPKTRRSAPATPTPVRTRTRPAGAITPSGTIRPSRPATTPTTRPATRPSPTPAPSTTPVAPTTSPTANETDHRPPGQTKEPQRGGQDKTHGPKR